MYRFIFYIIFFSCVNFSIAQNNLIYNGSFEEFYSCPFQNDLNNGELEKVKGWWKPTGGTSDYFNRCNTGMVSVPNNFWGYQEAFQGDGYVGIVPTEWTKSGNYLGNEYIQTKLEKTLKGCYEYKLIMYVSLAEYSHYSISQLGALFSKDTIGINTDFGVQVINQSIQVVNTEGNLSESLNWKKIEGKFVAKGDEKFITIGYFSPTVLNDTIFIQNSILDSYAPYYYIDSVSLFEIGLNVVECEFFEFHVPNIFTPNLDLTNDVIDISDILFLNPQMFIYNRWGALISILNTENPIWDGTFESENCTDGVYYYIMNYETTNEKQTKNGYIHLIRFL